VLCSTFGEDGTQESRLFIKAVIGIACSIVTMLVD
jgi:hypothetical protein